MKVWYWSSVRKIKMEEVIVWEAMEEFIVWLDLHIK